MPAHFIHQGNAIDYSPAIDIPMGTVVVLTDLVGVAVRPIPAGTIGSLQMTGVFSMPRETGSATAAGKSLYWDATNQVVTPTKQGHTYCGVAVREATADAETVLVRLNH